MRPTSAFRSPLKVAALVAVLALVFAACQQATPAPGGSEAPGVTVQAVTAQSGQLQPAPAGAQPSGWETAEAQRGSLRLLAKFDSSGDAAWDQVKHPTVFVTSMGKAPVPAGSPSPAPGGKIDGTGLYIIDAYTKEVVTSRVYDLGETVTQSSHTVGISPDGKWFYFMFGDSVASTKQNRNLIGIVSSKTLKLDKVLQHPTQRLHHVGSFKDS